MGQQVPTEAEIEALLKERRNWNRWGENDELGAINLIDTRKRVEAAQLVRDGRVLPLGRDLPTTPGPGNPKPARHYTDIMEPDHWAGWGTVHDYIALDHHAASTHIDALCHTWLPEGMWNGRDRRQAIGIGGVQFAGVEKWADGIITRGVLLDVPKHRGEPFVTFERPVHGWELEEVVKKQGIELRPGDGVCVYGGRDEWDRAHPDTPFGTSKQRPGLHGSCLKFFRDHDVAMLLWDMNDLFPSGYKIPFPIHGAIPAYGMAIVDNVILEDLAEACAADGRYEFMLTVSPLRIKGGTASLVNPLAIF